MASKLKAFLGYFTAALMLPVAIVLLMSMDPVSQWLVKSTGVVISPWFTGGEVVRRLSHDGYSTNLHRPVFDGLIGERSEGFVQVVWSPAVRLPATLHEEIDYDNDGTVDFAITLHPGSKTAEWQTYTPKALQLDGPYEIGNGIGVRIRLRK